MSQSRKFPSSVLLLLLGIAVMTIVYGSHLFVRSNTTISNLVYVSAELVEDAMYAENWDGNDVDYGLTDFYHVFGDAESLPSNEEYLHGWSLSENKFMVPMNSSTEVIFTPGNQIVFAYGTEANVSDVEVYADCLIVSFDRADGSTEYMGPEGSLNYMQVYDAETGRAFHMGDAYGYESQLGLQGKVFTVLRGNRTIYAMVKGGQWILAFLLALILTLISYGIYKKYNLTAGIVFYLVSLLSPWISGFSTNLYWVEFTWFIPMLVGIYAANHYHNRGCRVVAYIGAFLSIGLKCACGYEYISVIMMGTIVFLLADCTMAMIRKEKAEWKLLLRTIFLIGICALAGFVTVLLIHARIRGDGYIISGLKQIYTEDVLRRTVGGSASDYGAIYSESINTPLYYVLARYFYFQTPLLWGIPGLLFPVLALVASILVLLPAIRKKQTKKDSDLLALYIWIGLMCISWFVLGKSHSAEHTHLNFVMWYMGYVQISVYVVVCRIKNLVVRWKSEKQSKVGITEK